MAPNAPQLTIIAVFVTAVLFACVAGASRRRRRLAAALAALPATTAAIPPGLLTPAARAILASAPRTTAEPPPVDGSGEADGEYAGVHFASAVSSALGLLARGRGGRLPVGAALREQADGVDRSGIYYGADADGGGGKGGKGGGGGGEE